MRVKLGMILFVTLTFLLTGCGKKEPVIPSTVPVESSVVNVDEPEIRKVILADLTQEELFALTILEFKTALEEQMPDYKEHYKVPDRTLVEEDWEQIRELYSLEHFNSRLPKMTDTDNMVLEEFKEDPDAIYYAPTPEYLKSLTTVEFGEYLNKQYEYLHGSPLPEGIDFSTMEAEKLEVVRNEYIEGFSVSE